MISGYELMVSCLAINLYHEARGEMIQDQWAVAMVTLNRAKASGKDVCDVVFEPHQFSWTDWGYAHGKLTLAGKPKDEFRWKLSKKIAERAMTMRDFTMGATHYHATSVKPYWAKPEAVVGKWGHHIFYRGV